MPATTMQQQVAMMDHVHSLDVMTRMLATSIHKQVAMMALAAIRVAPMQPH
jgi:hypothetical protein